MKKLQRPIDQNIVVRWLHLHCFLHMFRVFKSNDASAVFSQPRFEMFKPVKRLFNTKNTSHSLFKNLLYTYKEEIMIGCIVTIIFACLNLLVPQLIRSFLTDMQGYGLKKIRVKTSSLFAEQFVLLQLLRLIFGEHSKRLFSQLAIKVQSTLSKKLVQKSLRMAKQCTDRIPQSQIYQLQNVDLRLIFTQFKNLYLVFEAPVTVIGALMLLFLESPSYGMIAIYWFLIAFFLQRELDGRMAHCNQTKLNLIDKRSQINYQILSKIKAAKMVGCQNLLIQKNNDLFIHQNHDHELYYFYAALYDITLLMLPIMVVITISLFDAGQTNHITVQEVYVMLSLLQICYNPMKSIQTIVISFHDGLHSLNRLTTYFSLPDEIQSALLRRIIGNPELHIKKNTISAYPHSNYDFWLIIKTQIDIKGSERLSVIGKKGQGTSSFVHMLVGSMKKIKGNVFLSGKIAYLPDRHVFSSATVKQNIIFFNNQIADSQVKEIYDKLGLKTQLQYLADNGLSIQMNSEFGFTKSQLQRIALARVFCSNSDVYILDNPFNNLNKQNSLNVEKMLRQKQSKGVMIIMSVKTIEFPQQNDQFLILDEGISIQYGKYKDLMHNHDSRISKFLKVKQQTLQVKSANKKQALNQFKKRVHRSISFGKFFQKFIKTESKEEKQEQIEKQSINQQSFKPSNHTLQNKKIQVMKKKNQILTKEAKKPHFSFLNYLFQFLTAAAPTETAFIYVIIISAELLHIFIHFFIGHEYEEHQQNDYASFRNLMAIQFILTVGLAGILYLEGEVSSKLAVIKGNTIYSKALKTLSCQSQIWFNDQFAIKIADKFNHDYEEVFIVWHNILNIYKNCIILIATIFFVTTNKQAIVIIIFFIGTIYISILMFLRFVESKVVKHFYRYKYEFVKVFQQSITASQIIKVYNVKTEFLERAEKKYLNLAAYKLSQSYISYGEQIFCDLVSIILLGLAFQYGLQMKIHGKSTAIIATTIFLLINLSEVLKKIVKLTVNLQSYFYLNVEPFMQFYMPNNQMYIKDYSKPIKEDLQPIQHHIYFKNVIFQYHHCLGKIPQRQRNPLTLQITAGQKLLILQKSDIGRQYLIYAFTRNLPQFMKEWKAIDGRLQIGGKLINQISNQQLTRYVGVISEYNFFINGTLKQNVSWNVRFFDQFEATLFAKELKIEEDLQNFNELLLESKIQNVEGFINSQLNKKIALMRILCIKPKIVIIKDTPSFIGEKSMVQIIQNHIPNCTIIKISSSIEVSFDMQRIILMQNLKVIEQGFKNDLFKNQDSEIGKLLKSSNIEGYLYTNIASVSPRKYKSRASLVGFL